MLMFRCRFCGLTLGTGDADEHNEWAQNCPGCHVDNVAEGYAFLVDDEVDNDEWDEWDG